MWNGKFCKFQIQFSQLQLYKSLNQSILSRQNLFKFLSSTIKLIFQIQQIFSFPRRYNSAILPATPSSPPLFSRFPALPGRQYIFHYRSMRVSRNVIECWRGLFFFFFKRRKKWRDVRIRANFFFSFFFFSQGFACNKMERSNRGIKREWNRRVGGI